MSVTTMPHANGRQQQRKSLSSQLDRLDSILDGLDGALSGAITDAVKEAVTTATAEAVRATLIEVITNPDLIALLRGGALPIAQPHVPVATIPDEAALPQPNAISRAWRWSINKLKAVGQGIKSRVRSARDGVVSTYRQASSIWSLRRPVLIALGVGAVIGVTCYASSPWLAGVVSGVAASVAALGVQLAAWARRVFAYMPAMR